MKRLSIGLVAGAVSCALALTLLKAAPAVAKETVLHSFANGADGEGPFAGSINVKGTLYGTTESGGSYQRGTVFALDRKTGAEKVVYSFAGGADGADPEASLIDVKGTLYGTTNYGGTGCVACGTVFALDPNTGAETVVYSFCSQKNCTDGQNPSASLINVNGTLYGTTVGGGTYGYGTLFALNRNTAAETVVHSFGSGTDGAEPEASLIQVNGRLYGTTQYGGSYGRGTVFALNLKTGAETVVYSFCTRQNCTDGQSPSTSLIDVNGTLYGITNYGGENCQSGGGCGTVLALDPSTGTETVLYSFCSRQNCVDGAYPSGGLIDVNGILYGTTSDGGRQTCNVNRCGTVFALDPNTATETVVHSFGKGTDGQDPSASLINVGSALYGTTQTGGTYGYGTVFAIKKY